MLGHENGLVIDADCLDITIADVLMAQGIPEAGISSVSSSLKRQAEVALKTAKRTITPKWCFRVLSKDDLSKKDHFLSVLTPFLSSSGFFAASRVVERCSAPFGMPEKTAQSTVSRNFSKKGLKTGIFDKKGRGKAFFEHLVLCLYTLGDAFDEEMAKKGHSVGEKYALDAAGNACMRVLHSEVMCCLEKFVSKEKLGQLGDWIQPEGVDDFKRVQKALFQEINGKVIGVFCDQNGIMHPQKTCSGFMGIGHGLRARNHDNICCGCERRFDCLYRVH